MRCLAYRASRKCSNAWTACKNRAEKNSTFCQSHIRMICGVYLGLCIHGFPERNKGRRSAESATPTGSKQQ